jgi:hypothetical protein
MPYDSNCDYLAFVMWVETKAVLREMIPDHAEQHAHPHSIHALFGHHSVPKSSTDRTEVS